MHRREDQENWQCTVVVKDATNVDWVKVICRDETEIQLIKEAAQKTMVPDARAL